jgi:hypothetical protein
MTITTITCNQTTPIDVSICAGSFPGAFFFPANKYCARQRDCQRMAPEAKLKSPEIMGIKGEMPDEKGTSPRGRLGRVVVILRIRVRY